MLKVKGDSLGMEDNLKTATNENLGTLQTYLDDRVEDEHKVKLALQRQLEHNLGKKPKHHHYHAKIHRTQLLYLLSLEEQVSSYGTLL